MYTPDQVAQFLAATKTDRLHAMWHLVITTGLRRAELAGLQWCYLDLVSSPARLVVRTTRTTAGHSVVETRPKTKAGRRALILDQHMAQLLHEHRGKMAADVALRNETVLPTDVFVDEFGDPYHPARLTRILHTLQRRAGLPEITLHDLRHTAATVALLAGVHPKIVTERHGHASTQITLDRYSHVIESMQANAADAIRNFLSASF